MFRLKHRTVIKQKVTKRVTRWNNLSTLQCLCSCWDLNLYVTENIWRAEIFNYKMRFYREIALYFFKIFLLKLRKFWNQDFYVDSRIWVGDVGFGGCVIILWHTDSLVRTFCCYSCCFVIFRRLHKMRRATVNFVMSVRLSTCMEQLSSYWTDFYEIWFLTIFEKYVEEIEVSL